MPATASKAAAMKRPKTRHVPQGKVMFGVYISTALRDRVDKALVGPYRVTLTVLVERGLELALRELNEIHADIR